MGTPFPEIVHALQADEHLRELDVDVVHDHSMGGPLTARARRTPTVLTAHGPVTGELGECYRLLSRHHPMVAISEAQRAKGPHLPWAGTVYNARSTYPVRDRKDGFVLFLGRISPKGPDLAIKAARAAGRRVVIAAKWRAGSAFDQRCGLLGRTPSEGATTEERSCWRGQRARLPSMGRAVRDRDGRAMACGTPVALRAGSVRLVVDP
jgi:hypothetical protein